MDLVLGLWESAEGWSGVVTYATDLWDEPWAAGLAGHFVTVLRQAVADPGRRIGELELLSPAERDLLLAEWNGPAEVPAGTVVELIEAQARDRPAEPAIVAPGGSTVTHGELNARANRIAHHLRDLGVGPDVVVGLCLERSVDLPAAMLGVLKAGGAYLPLDPRHPPARLAHLLADAGARVVVATARQRAVLPPDPGVALVLLDEDAAAIDARPDTDPGVPLTPQTLAYVLHTSGSTGTPKGVLLEHQSARTVTGWLQAAFPMGPGDRMLLKTSFTFDVSIWEIFWPLLAGAAVVLLEPGRELDPRHVAEVLDRERVTHVNFVPSVLKEFLRANPGRVGPHLRVAFSGGEALSAGLRDRFLERCPARLVNLYGPTESSITWWECRRDDAGGAGGEAGDVVPIGRGIDNVRVHVLDGDLRLVPPGAVGEICIGGAGVARGYAGPPGPGDERFAADPYTPGGRLYRTGDLGRRRPDGALEFLGRADDQVKVRGFRVEPAEVEAALRDVPGVADAVVVPQEVGGERRLAGYLVPAAGAEAALSVSAVRARLLGTLPDHLVPPWLVTLEALPLNRHGKVDRAALPLPAGGRPALAAELVPPRTEVERVLCEVWEEVLGVSGVGVRDNFFDLGGHSLLSVQIASRVRETLGLELPLTAVFDVPTVEGLAAVLAKTREAGEAARPPVRRVTREGEPVALSASQRRLWFLDRLVPGNPFYVACMALRFGGPLDAESLAAAFTGLVERHQALRTVFPGRDGEPFQVVLPAEPVPIPVVDLTHLPPPEAERRARELAAEEAATPCDLARGPMLRVTLLRVGPDDDVLVVSMHHIVADGWSWRVALQEVSARYAAHRRGEASPSPELPELPVQYPDYAVWQARLEADREADELAYWRGRLAGMTPIELPTDRPRPAETAYVGATHDEPVPDEVAAALPALCAAAGATTFMVTLAAFLVVLARWSGQRDIAVGTPVAGRNRTELEDLVGMFVNNLVLRVDVGESSTGGDPTFEELLATVRRVVTEAQNHQDLPFDRLVEDLRPPRQLSRNPLIPVVFSAEEDAFDASMTVGPGLGPAPLVGTWDATAHVHNDLHVAVLGRDSGMVVMFRYSTELWDAASMAAMAGHFVAVLRQAVEDPGRRVGELEVVTPAERRLLLEEWNGPAAPPGGTVLELFARRVLERPDAAALTWAGEEVSVAALDARANRIAHRLAELGVGPEVVVGVCLERSADLVATVLGVLKAGGAYLPLDPGYPPGRLAFMLGDAGAALVVTAARHRGVLPPDGRVLVLDDREDAAALAARPATDPGVRVGPHRLAYVLYTSGSTGTPKGVMVEHGSLRNFADAFVAPLYGEHRRRLAFTANTSFDASLSPLLGMVCGSTLVLVPEEVRRDPPAFVEAAAAAGVDAVDCTPSQLQAWMAAGLLDGAVPLRSIVLGGEEVGPSLWRRLARLPDCRCVNAYGPSEVTVDATLAEIAPGTTPSIGRPFGGVRVYVLDGDLRLVPPGVAGEICVGGVGVARGYAGRPDLTDARFVADPFVPGGRLYRTGDVGRWRRDGRLEFLGRADDQVKMRGFRVETGEVEATLRTLPGVTEAVVVPWTDDAGLQCLAAYLAGPSPPSAAETRAWCAGVLPAYLVPQFVVPLEELPLSAGGKVDRARLPAPGPAAAPGDAPGEAGVVRPRTDSEARAARVVAAVLGLAEVGVTDDFFALGGHSLLVLRLASGLTDAFRTEVPPRLVFEHPTVEGIARAVDNRLVGGDRA
jgi:amino acid adenylation domain-containing protein